MQQFFKIRKYSKIEIWILSPLLFILVQCAQPQADTLVDKNATSETRALMHNLKTLSGKGLLFGHQDDMAYGVTWWAEEGHSDVKDVCGDYPAVMGWDVSQLGQTPYNIDSVDFEHMKKWIRDTYRRGGVNTISWHMDNPATGGSSWDNTRAVYSILEGGQHHEWYIQKLDLFASFLHELQDDSGVAIPIIFRPFHEHTGNWFWWGRGNCTSSEFVELWRLTIHYLRDVKGLHQLLYAYSTDRFSSREDYLEFYPGDEFVDILAYDDYHSIRSKDSREEFVRQLRTIVELAEEKGKLAALTETGLEKIPDPKWFTSVLLDGIKSDPKGARISYVLVWRNGRKDHHYAPYPGHASAEDFINFYHDPYTIFNGDLPPLYKIP